VTFAESCPQPVGKRDGACGEVSTRPMREDDLDKVIAVENAAYEFPWTLGVFRDCLRVGYSCWIVEVNEQTVGHGIMSVAAQEAHILNLCIIPAVQRIGLGQALLEHLLDVAKAHQANELFLEVRPSNHAASRLYERAGFSSVGFRKAYYPDHTGREDAIVMSINLRAR
jgi:[ribosomal protein S18]-alanine N-acetyltransferase